MIVKIVNKSGLPLPQYQSNGAAAADICSCEDVNIQHKEVKLIHTGLYVEIPKGWCMKLFARSSLHKKGLFLSNGVGVIDSDYRGEILVSIWNCGLPGSVNIKKGERIAQITLERVEPIEWVEVDALSDTERGSGGFGSSGK